jgi:hypothetical protein
MIYLSVHMSGCCAYGVTLNQKQGAAGPIDGLQLLVAELHYDQQVQVHHLWHHVRVGLPINATTQGLLQTSHTHNLIHHKSITQMRAQSTPSSLTSACLLPPCLVANKHLYQR